MLLELTRDLLDRAEHDHNEPIPIVFLLSAWTAKQLPLADWLVEEMHNRYHIPRRIGQAWVNAGQVLPLLDGLDEVASTHREECIKKINDYQQKQELGMVVCSRGVDYLTQKTKVRLRTAVVVQPLTTQEIENYLTSAGGQLAKLRVALPKDAGLRELIATPLMLSVLTLAYHSIPLTDILKPSALETRRRKVFATYVEQMLTRRKIETRKSQRQRDVTGTREPPRNNPRYTQQQTMHWLTWLAQQLALHNWTEFSISQMGENWLPQGRSNSFYGGFAKGLYLGFVSAAVVQVIFGVIFGFCLGLPWSRVPSGVAVWNLD